MKESIATGINEQIRLEFSAAYQYLAMSSYFEAENLPGMARWMREQSKEELEHAMKFVDFMNDRGVAPELKEIAAPRATFGSPIEVFQAAFDHEVKVTQAIYSLYELSMNERDYPLQMLLQWFITEQLEEEKITSAVVERLKMVEGSRSALVFLDSELGGRQGEEIPV